MQQSARLRNDSPHVVPLSFDRANDGCPITSSFPIFRLPVELLGHVTPYLFHADLKSLSLVDQDCRQLARSIQFVDVKMDCSNAAFGLLSRLAAESQTRLTLADTQSPTIGCCIRRLVVETDYSLLNARVGTEAGSLLGFHRDERHERIHKSQSVHRAYLQKLCEAICHAMPNLHVLDWSSMEIMTPEMMSCIAASSVKHLSLSGIQVGEVFQVAPPAKAEKWALETLIIRVFWLLSDTTGQDTSSFINSILYQSAPTLQKLIWKRGSNFFHGFNHSLRNDLHFPSLRTLVLNGVVNDFSSDGDTVLRALLGSKTRVRALAIDSSSVTTSKFLASRGPIFTLESFYWINRPSDIQHEGVFTFLSANSHISTLSTSFALSSTLLDMVILPMLQNDFNNLTSVHLIWDSVFISKESLEVIASINSLQHLWLSAGNQLGWSHDWVIDHDVLIDALKPLCLLQSLAFTRDTYVVEGHMLLDSSVQGYYINKVLPIDEQFSDYLDEVELTALRDSGGANVVDTFLAARHTMLIMAWERWHRKRMRAFAGRYVECFPNLEWCYMGQLPMRVAGGSGEQTVEPEIIERDYCMSHLKRRWGLTGDDYN